MMIEIGLHSEDKKTGGTVEKEAAMLDQEMTMTGA
jgi:hypothetical protein